MVKCREGDREWLFLFECNKPDLSILYFKLHLCITWIKIKAKTKTKKIYIIFPLQEWIYN